MRALYNSCKYEAETQAINHHRWKQNGRYRNLPRKSPHKMQNTASLPHFVRSVLTGGPIGCADRPEPLRVARGLRPCSQTAAIGLPASNTLNPAASSGRPAALPRRSTPKAMDDHHHRTANPPPGRPDMDDHLESNHG